MSTTAFISCECLWFWAFLCGHIQVHQHGWGGEPATQLSLKEQTQRSDAGPRSFAGLIFPSQTAPHYSWADVWASLFSVSCLTFVLSAFSPLCKRLPGAAVVLSAWPLDLPTVSFILKSFEILQAGSKGRHWTPLFMGLLLFVGVLALHQAPALRILSCLHRLPSQPHKLAEEISHFFLSSCETSLPLPFQASPISALITAWLVWINPLSGRYVNWCWLPSCKMEVSVL